MDINLDTFFGANGPLAQQLPNYEKRAPQIQMARMVERAMIDNTPAMIEAGTGTGKSLAYLIPALLTNRTIVVSTANKALQMQLINKELPFLQNFFPDMKFALAQGKSNYMCRAKCETLGSVSLPDGELRQWYNSTETGNIEEITFQQPDDISEYTVGDDCTGKKCPLYDSCFYYAAKAKRQEADVVVCNHALLAMDHLYPYAEILPKGAMIVVDEAHQLADSVRSMMTGELDISRIQRAIQTASRYGIVVDGELCDLFLSEIKDYVGMSTDNQVGINVADTFNNGLQLAQELWKASEQIWNPYDTPKEAEERKAKRDAKRIANTGDIVNRFSQRTQKNQVRWIETKDGLKLVASPIDVSHVIQKLSGYNPNYTSDSCWICKDDFADDIVFVGDFNLGCCMDCVEGADEVHEFEEMTIEEWHALPASKSPEQVPIIFTSATLALPDMKYFKRECGISESLEMVVDSPFDYEENALLYVPNGNSPSPNDTQKFLNHLVDEMIKLVHASQGGALILFTSYANMQHCYDSLQYEFQDYKVLRQGDYPKAELIKQFKEDGNAVLFATKSFWEGVDVIGPALRMVIMDKLPFEARTPLANAQSEQLRQRAASQGVKGKTLEFYAFNNMSIPRMIKTFKQGFGRLIRSQSDTGVIAVLDPRVRTAFYGRKYIIPSLPDIFMTDKMDYVRMVFANFQPAKPATSMQIFGLMTDTPIDEIVEVPF